MVGLKFRMLSLAVFAGSCFTFGCVNPPERQDPFAGLTRPPSVYKDWTVGLILSGNTKQAIKYSQDYFAAMGIGIKYDGPQAETLFTDISAMLQKHFKAVLKMDQVENAASVNVDVIVVLDVYASYPNNVFEVAEVNAKMIFMTPDAKPLDEVSGHGLAKVIPFSATQPVAPAVMKASEAAVRELEAGLIKSSKLAVFGKIKENGPVETVHLTTTSGGPAASPGGDDRLVISDPRGVQVLGKAPAQYVSEQFGKSWAVVIGIDDYEKAPRLKYATADAQAMAAVLRQQGFQVAELYNRQATKSAIEGELSDRLVDRVGENDRVVIFYAGHGETKTVRGGKTMGYLLPVEGQPDALGQTGVSMGRIKELADALPSKQVLFLVDVCYGGIAGQQFRSTLPPMTVAYLKQITRERGRQLISAGGPDQQAMESPEWGHSVFTYYLLEGLKGLADLNDDGIIPASELYSYLDARVFAAAQMKGHTQRPELWSLAAEKGEFVFIPPRQPAASSVGIETTR